MSTSSSRLSSFNTDIITYKEAETLSFLFFLCYAGSAAVCVSLPLHRVLCIVNLHNMRNCCCMIAHRIDFRPRVPPCFLFKGTVHLKMAASCSGVENLRARGGREPFVQPQHTEERENTILFRQLTKEVCKQTMTVSNRKI